MPTRTLSPAASRPPRTDERISRVLAVAAGPGSGGRDRAPDWVLRWVRRVGWQLRWHAEAGPGAAAAAAAAMLDARVLLLRPTEAGEPPSAGRPEHLLHVVAALRDMPDDAPVMADAAACAAHAGAALTLVHAVPRSFGERSVGLDGAVAHGRRLLDTAVRQVAAREPTLSVDCALLRVRPYELVGEALDADLLVVGGPRADRRPPGRLGPGLVAHSALHHAPCPVLLVPR
jgi:nucleotide-binding universal stress UspA family protein